MVMDRLRVGLGAGGRPWAEAESDDDSNANGEIERAGELAVDGVDTRSGEAVMRLIVLQFLRVMTSKVPPSAKCCFWALVHPPKTASMVKSSTLGNCPANSEAILALRGR